MAVPLALRVTRAMVRRCRRFLNLQVLLLTGMAALLVLQQQRPEIREVLLRLLQLRATRGRTDHHLRRLQRPEVATLLVVLTEEIIDVLYSSRNATCVSENMSSRSTNAGEMFRRNEDCAWVSKFFT